MKPLRKTLLIAFIHFVIGNLIGIHFSGSNTVEDTLIIIGLPYSFIAGLSDFADWAWLSLVFEVIAFWLMCVLIYTLVRIFSKQK